MPFLMKSGRSIAGWMILCAACFLVVRPARAQQNDELRQQLQQFVGGPAYKGKTSGISYGFRLRHGG